MKIKKVMYFFLLVVLCVGIKVDAGIKCGEGKPGDVVSCVVSDLIVKGTTKNISVDNGLTFESCDICTSDGAYSLTKDKSATFKFKVSSDITSNKTLKVTIAGEDGKINVVAETTTTTNDNEITYTVTLVPGKGKSNKTKTCTVNSLNTTCNVTLDELDDENFTGWGADKNCTEGSKGNIKVKKDITYYACYKKSSNDSNVDSDSDTNIEKENNNNNSNNNNNTNDNKENTSSNENDILLLKSLKLMNGEEEINFDFSIRTREYDLTVGLDVESIVIDAVPQDKDVEVSYEGNDNLKEGKNTITITLTSDDGETSEYILNVTKTEKIVAPLLSNLVIGGVSNIDFKPEKFVYNVSVEKDINKLIIQHEVDNENYDVEILDNENLKDGSQIRLIVTDSETESSSTYIINVAKESSNLIMYIIIGSLLLIVLVVLLIIVIKKGKSTKQKGDSNKTQSKKNVKGTKVVNTIPEVGAPVQNIVPVSPNENKEEKKEEIEILDF